jgi:1,5-anhydro-D-fructose reductase (1,5-anhydro-D-mannitol-forming)
MIPAMRRLGQEPLAVLSSSPDRGRDFAEQNDVGRVVTDLADLLSDERIDAVYISTTNELHRDQTLAAAQAGKHVLCEKPLALTTAEAWEMVSVCREAGVVLATNHHLPGAGTHRRVAELVRNGAIGRPLAVRVFHAVKLPERLQGWRLSQADRGAGVILDITCHDAAAVRAVLGKDAVEVAAVTVRQGPWDAAVEDAVMTSMQFEDDILVQTHDAFTVAYAETGLQVHGDAGSIYASGVMTQDPVGEVRLRDAAGERTIDPEDQRDLYEVGLDAFAHAVAGCGAPIVDGADGAKAVAIALAAKQAAETGQTVTVLPEPAVEPRTA